MLALKNKRIFIPVAETLKCIFCTKDIDKESHAISPILTDGKKYHSHDNCLDEHLKRLAIQALSLNQNFPLKKSCLCCHGETHLPDIDNDSLFKLGLNPVSFVIIFGKTKRTVKVHQACLLATAHNKKPNFQALLSRAKIHKLKTIPPLNKSYISNPICALCNSEVSTKKGNSFVTNNLHFHQNCVQTLVSEVFTMKTAAAYTFNASDVSQFACSCIFCKKSHSLDHVSVHTEKPVYLNPDRELTVGFHRECLLAFASPMKKAGSF